MNRELKPIVCLCVYDRQQMCGKWLRAWENAKKFGAKLVVIHNFDPNPGSPKVEQVNRILEWQPDYYIPRLNRGGDIGAFQDFLVRRDEFYHWDAVFWFADDCLPMRRDFLQPFLNQLSLPHVGLVGAFYEPHPEHIRTCAFALKREVALQLQFPQKLMEHPRERYQFEHGVGNMFWQVKNMSYNVALAYGDFDTEWCHDQTLIWDTDHCFNHDLWHIYERQFSDECENTN